MTKPHAGNTGRHDYDGKGFCPCGAEVGCESSDRICSAPNSILWDRLRADLNNLGAAYGVLPEPQGPLTPFGEALQSLSHGLAGAATSQRRDSEPVEIKAGEPISHPTTRKGYTIASETDRNLYYDGIILAARKKRERSQVVDMSDHGHHWGHNVDGCERCGLTGTEILTFKSVADIPACDGGKSRDLRNKLSQAMDRPLSFPKRIGWKPGDGGEGWE